MSSLLWFTFGFLISKTMPYVWNKCYKNEQHISLVAYSITKLTQNVCLISTHTLIYRCARCDNKLWNVIWFYCVLLGIFIHNWRVFMSEVSYLHQNFTDWYVNIPNMTAGYRMFSNLMLFFYKFLYSITCSKRYNFIILLKFYVKKCRDEK